MEGIQVMESDNVNVFLDEISREEMAAYVEMHSPVAGIPGSSRICTAGKLISFVPVTGSVFEVSVYHKIYRLPNSP